MVYLGLLKTKQRFLSIHFLLIFFGFGKELKRILGKEKKKIPSYFLLDCLDFLALCNRKNDLTIFETRLLQFFALRNCLKKVRLMSILCSFFLRWKPRCSNRILHFLDGGLEHTAAKIEFFYQFNAKFNINSVNPTFPLQSVQWFSSHLTTSLCPLWQAIFKSLKWLWTFASVCSTGQLCSILLICGDSTFFVPLRCPQFRFERLCIKFQ